MQLISTGQSFKERTAHRTFTPEIAFKVSKPSFRYVLHQVRGQKTRSFTLTHEIWHIVPAEEKHLQDLQEIYKLCKEAWSGTARSIHVLSRRSQDQVSVLTGVTYVNMSWNVCKAFIG